MSNQAAWLDGQNKKIRVGEASMPKAGKGEIIVKNHAVAVNPVDWKIQDSGMFIQKWPTVLGCDAAGEVVEVGEGVSNVKKGDRVTGHCLSLVNSDPAHGGFQLYSVLVAEKSAVLPEKVSYAEGSVIPLALDTAAVGLYSPEKDGYLGLPLPTLGSPKDAGKTIVVWGGSSSVGALAIQLAVSSGAKVVTVASERNFDFCKKLGASEVLDYKKSSVVDDVVEAVKKVGGTFVGTYDAISLEEDSYKYTVPITEKLGGKSLAVVLGAPKEVPNSIKAGGIFGVNELTHQIWTGFVTKALESGQLKAVPEPLVIGKGLESVQKGFDKNKEGVSAKKVVIEL